MKKLLFAAAVAVLPAACQSVPFTNRNRLLLVSAEQENSMGLSAYEETLKGAKLVKAGPQADLVRKVGERIAKAADKPDFKWEFSLIDDPQMNAFCLPGGKVAVYTGILKVTQDEQGLAVVMGHEVAHALARHGAERVSQGLLAQAGGVALDAALAQKPAQTRQMFGQAYGLGVNMGVLLPFSRSHESEADRIGLILMAKAGYEPGAAVGFWRRMSSQAGSAGKPPEFLSTHPSDERRIRDIETRLPEARKYLSKPS